MMMHIIESKIEKTMSLLRILNVLWISVWVLSLSDGYSLRYVHRTRPIASSLATKQHITANHVHKSQYTSQHTIRLHGSSTDGDEDEILQPKVQGMKGYYVRPSRAIEKGGGFFIPGLEGGKIRIISASVILVLLVVNNFSAANLIASSAQVSAAIGTSVLVGVIASLLLFIQGTLSLFPSLIRPDSGRDASVETEGSNSNGGGELAILAPKATEQRKDVISIARAILQTIEGVCSVVVIEKAAGNRLLLEVGPLSKTALKDSDISSNTLTILQQITANDKITMIPFTDFITRCPDLAKKTSQSFNKEMQQIAIGRRSSHEDETNAMKDGAEEYWMVGLAKSSELTDNYNGVKKWLSSLLDSPTANNSTR